MTHRKLKELLADQTLLHAAPDALVSEVVQDMQRNRYSCVPVIEEGELKGVFTSSDLVRRVLEAGLDPAETSIADVMTAEPHCIDGDCHGHEAVQMMRDRRIHHLVVVGCGENGYCVVTTADFPDDEFKEIEEELAFEQRLWEEL